MAAEFRPIVRVKGYREFVRAINRAGPETKAAVTIALKAIGEPVREDAARRLETYSQRSVASHKRSAQGFKVKVNVNTLKVQQSIRKTTGKHPEYGALQMRRALLPARTANNLRTREEFEKALDVVVTHFNSSP